MSKPVYKIVDDRGRITIPAPVRASLGIASGDVVAITAGRGSITVKKAIVFDGSGGMPMAAKEAYVETVMREMPPDKLTGLLELAVRLLQDHNK